MIFSAVRRHLMQIWFFTFNLESNLEILFWSNIQMFAKYWKNIEKMMKIKFKLENTKNLNIWRKCIFWQTEPEGSKNFLIFLKVGQSVNLNCTSRA